MSFDTLAIVGVLSVVLIGGFLIALVSCNDTGRCRSDNLISRRRAADERQGA